MEECVVLGALRQALATPCHDEGRHVDAALPALPAAQGLFVLPSAQQCVQCGLAVNLP